MRRALRRRYGRSRRSADYLRSVTFRPYRKGMGPTFKLTMWDTNRTDHYGKFIVRYQLTMTEHGKSHVLFRGSDFATPNAIDGDASVRGLMSFLTLKPGDTDSDYFEGYTPAQLAYADHHAEALQMAVIDKFGED